MNACLRCGHVGLHICSDLDAAMLRHPSNTSPAPVAANNCQQPTTSDAYPSASSESPEAASAGEALSPEDMARALTSAAQAIGQLTQRVIELHAEVEQMKAQMQHSVVYVPVVGEVT